MMIGPNERLDDLGINNLFIIQNPEYFCFGIDAVLLSGYVKAKRGERVLDLCSGNGILPILLSAKTKAAEIIGLEIQPQLCEMASRSFEYNQITDRVKMINGDLRESSTLFVQEEFDVITVNPPYMKAGDGKANDNRALRIARHEELCTFKDVMECAEHLLKSKGRIYIVHRPTRLVELLKTMTDSGVEPKSMRLVHPYVHKEPNMVLIEGVKGAGCELRIGPPLIVYESPERYTKEVMRIYGYE